MLNLNTALTKSKSAQVLFLGAHGDDIEIGCGATILKLAEQYPKMKFHWAVFSADAVRQKEILHSAKLFLSKVKTAEIDIYDFEDGFFPYNGEEIKEQFEDLKNRIDPDIIFTHYRDDRHQDHRLINELTWNSFRNHLIFEYEIPKFDGDIGIPNCFVPIDKKTMNRKISYLFKAYKSQSKKHWFTEELFKSLPRLRGMETGGGTGYAEAFYGRKIVLS